MPKKKSSSSDLGVSGGKGDSPRSCFSQQFRDNYDAIEWHRAGNAPIEDFVEILNAPNEGELEYSASRGTRAWTKENDDALHAFCDKLETDVCNISLPKSN